MLADRRFELDQLELGDRAAIEVAAQELFGWDHVIERWRRWVGLKEELEALGLKLGRDQPQPPSPPTIRALAVRGLGIVVIAAVWVVGLLILWANRELIGEWLGLLLDFWR